MSFNFQRQLEVGNNGEALLLEHYRSTEGQVLHKIDAKSPIGDFLLQPSGKIVEVKTDTYLMERTPNFFMEFHSNLEKKTLGGPWRAFDLGADIFLYLFLNNRTYFEFSSPQKLVQRCEDIIKKGKLKPMRILNKSWITTGYKIPRNEVRDLYTITKIDAESSKVSKPTSDKLFDEAMTYAITEYGSTIEKLK